MKVTLLSMTLIFSAFPAFANEAVEDKSLVPWDCMEGTGGEEFPADFRRFCAMDARGRQEIRDSFHLARVLYVQGEYSLCLEQLNIVRSKVSRFQNSDELREFCDQGIDILHRTAELERKNSIRRAPSAIEKIKKSN